MLHPTRLSLMSGATPQAAPGYRKLVEGYTSQVRVCTLCYNVLAAALHWGTGGSGGGGSGFCGGGGGFCGFASLNLRTSTTARRVKHFTSHQGLTRSPAAAAAAAAAGSPPSTRCVVAAPSASTRAPSERAMEHSTAPVTPAPLAAAATASPASESAPVKQPLAEPAERERGRERSRQMSCALPLHAVSPIPNAAREARRMQREKLLLLSAL
jgi:hypothetical protein